MAGDQFFSPEKRSLEKISFTLIGIFKKLLIAPLPFHLDKKRLTV